MTNDLTIDICYKGNSEIWQDKQQIETLVNKSCNAVMPHFELENCEVSIALADNDFVQQLNKQYRNQDKPTNVLSFPIDDTNLTELPPQLGDIIVAFETVKNECEQQQKSFENHFCHLIIHGMLHLLGLDHIQPDDAVEMEELEKQILLSMGINDPYAGTEIIG